MIVVGLLIQRRLTNINTKGRSDYSKQMTGRKRCQFQHLVCLPGDFLLPLSDRFEVVAVKRPLPTDASVRSFDFLTKHSFMHECQFDSQRNYNQLRVTTTGSAIVMLNTYINSRMSFAFECIFHLRKQTPAGKKNKL